MDVYVLILVVFFYGSTLKHPEAAGRSYPSPEACLADIAPTLAKARAAEEVESATAACFQVTQQHDT